MKRSTIQEAYENLAIAICKQAVEDFKLRDYKEDVKAFFKSNFFYNLFPNIDGEYIISQLEA